MNLRSFVIIVGFVASNLTRFLGRKEMGSRFNREACFPKPLARTDVHVLSALNVHLASKKWTPVNILQVGRKCFFFCTHKRKFSFCALDIHWLPWVPMKKRMMYAPNSGIGRARCFIYDGPRLLVSVAWSDQEFCARDIYSNSSQLFISRWRKFLAEEHNRDPG